MNIIYDPEKHFLGKLCNHDHDWENSGFSLRKISTNRCVICEREQSKRSYERRGTPEYNKKCYEKYGKDFHYRNRERRLEEQKKYRENNSDLESERHRIYREANLEKILEAGKNYYQRNRTKILERCRNYRKLNADKIRERQLIYYKSNTDKIRGRRREYLKSPAGKNCILRQTQKRYSRKNGCHSQPYKREDVLNLFNGECAYCSSKDKLTIDHFIPLSKGGSDVQGNLLPACLSCNCSKHNRDVIEWYKSQPFFDKKRLKQILKILGKTESNYDQIPLF